MKFRKIKFEFPSWVRDLFYLGLIALIIVFFTVIPYFNTQVKVNAIKQNEVYQCKLSSILREFAATAAKVRLETAKVVSPKFREFNLREARIYVKILENLQKFPIEDCSQILK